MWGIHRTISKTINRLSIPIPVIVNLFPRKKNLLLVGCGQFGLSTASFFIAKTMGNKFLGCFDINYNQAKRAKKNYGYENVCKTFEQLINLKGAKYLFISSNHASHTPQAIAGLNKNLYVHVEKPVSVTWEQLADLSKTIRGKEDKFFVGYNRPFAKATYLLRKNIQQNDGLFTIQCFIAGHAINQDHWYYDAEEGTRICGNVGHWIDFIIHILSQAYLADNWKINISYSDNKLRDENFSLNMISDRGDLATITFSTRGEPFDGVSETLIIQNNRLMAKIEDFQDMKLWVGNKYKRYRFWPKDVGHRSSVLQLFNIKKNYPRPWSEIFLSTTLILHITDMVKNDVKTSNFSFSKAENKINNLIKNKIEINS